MPFASWLLATTTLVTPAPQAAAVSAQQPVALVNMDASEPASDQKLPVSSRVPQQPPDPAPHRFGLGGAFTMNSRGSGAGVRYWFNDHVGLNAQTTWYRRTFDTPIGVQRATYFQAFTTATYLFGRADAARVANLRPYVGAGALYVQGRRPTGVQGASSGTGPVAFGGVEVSLLDYPGLTINNEIVYNGLPRNFIGSRDRVVYQFSIFMYLR
jgi:hypothetical protein